MEKRISIVFDKEGNSVDVWFCRPKKAVCEETESGLIIKKDPKSGEILGFEKLNF